MGTPQTVQDAILAKPLFVGDLKLQPLSLGMYLFLEKIDSPLIKGGTQNVRTLDLFRAVYVMATPLPELLALWSQGPEVFDAAVLGFADRVSLGEVEALGERIVNHIQAAFAPAAKTRPPEDASGPFPPSPPAAAA